MFILLKNGGENDKLITYRDLNHKTKIIKININNNVTQKSETRTYPAFLNSETVKLVLGNVHVKSL